MVHDVKCLLVKQSKINCIKILSIFSIFYVTFSSLTSYRVTLESQMLYILLMASHVCLPVIVCAALRSMWDVNLHDDSNTTLFKLNEKNLIKILIMVIKQTNEKTVGVVMGDLEITVDLLLTNFTL